MSVMVLIERYVCMYVYISYIGILMKGVKFNECKFSCLFH